MKNNYKSPIFCEKDFKLCFVPVPKGYPQSVTHCGVALSNNDIFLVMTPYPAKKRTVKARIINRVIRLMHVDAKLKSAESYENPCLYIGDENIKVPVAFKPFLNNPISCQPSSYNNLPSYNSDPDIFIENGYLHLFNRVVRRLNSKSATLNYDFFCEFEHYLIDITTKKIKTKDIIAKIESKFISPSIIKNNGDFYLMFLETYSYNDGKSFDGMYFYKVPNLNNLKQAHKKQKVKITGANVLPWHFSLFKYNNEVYAVIASVIKGEKGKCIQMLGKFKDDLTELYIYHKPLTNISSYRSSAIVKDNNFILYTTTDKYYFKGSTSVDGRDIIVASLDIATLIKEINQR